MTWNLNIGVSFSPILLINIIISSFMFHGILTTKRWRLPCIMTFKIRYIKTLVIIINLEVILPQNFDDLSFCLIDALKKKVS